MKKQLTLLIILLLGHVFHGMAQSYAVNDIVPGVKPDTFLQTNPISGSKITFIEKGFTLKFSKTDLINALKAAAREGDNDSEARYNRVIAYLSTTGYPNFKYIWTKTEDIEDLSWQEAGQAGAKTLAITLLKDNMCGLIEQGKFELYVAGKKQRSYFFGLVDTRYGQSAKGVFTTTNRLIWICPPWICCALPRF